MQKLVDYRNKAKIATILSAAIAVVLLAIYAVTIASAQASYYDTISSYSNLYEFAGERLAEVTSSVQPAMYLGIIASAVSGISLTLWMLANLLIAYKTPDEKEVRQA